MSKRARLSADDWAEIHNLYANYNLCSDSGDAEGYASCFTDDGVLNLVTRDFVVKGRQAFIEFKRKDVEGRAGRYRRHWNSGLHLEKQADGTVRGRCYLLAFNGEPGSLPVLAGAGVYDDTIVKADEEWRFASRKLKTDASTWSPPAVGSAGVAR
ncbi:MAG: nuclear transport factor 2 family protein [Gemmatimonadales bacterium]|nr:nuclear transport factor 2 family protein [Gemmatimonadales bacterium]